MRAPGTGRGKIGVRGNPFSAPRGAGRSSFYLSFQALPAFAGSPGFFVVNAETVPVDDGVGNPSDGAAKILPKWQKRGN